MNNVHEAFQIFPSLLVPRPRLPETNCSLLVPDSVVPLRPSFSAISHFLGTWIPLALQDSSNGLRRDLELLGQNGGRVLVTILLMESTDSNNRVWRELLTRTPSLRSEFLFQCFFLNLPYFFLSGRKSRLALHSRQRDISSGFRRLIRCLRSPLTIDRTCWCF